MEPVTSVLQPPEPLEYDGLEYAALPMELLEVIPKDVAAQPS
jgi:hypothetical protein